MMSHKLYYNSEVDCMILKVTGVVTLERIQKMAPRVAQMSEETGCLRLLNNMIEATIDISARGLFSSPTVMEESNVSHKIKRALVVSPSFDRAAFLENVTRKKGHDLMVFNEVDPAMTWLLTE